jgi:hypothetical protein
MKFTVTYTVTDSEIIEFPRQAQGNLKPGENTTELGDTSVLTRNV